MTTSGAPTTLLPPGDEGPERPPAHVLGVWGPRAEVKCRVGPTDKIARVQEPIWLIPSPLDYPPLRSDNVANHDDKQAERLNRELTKYQALDDAEIDEVIRGLLEEPKGQKFIWWLLQVGKYGLNPFSPDPTVMAFQAGEMNVGSAILTRLIEVNPLGFAQLQMKRKQEEDGRTAAARRIASGGDLFADDSDPNDAPGLSGYS